MFNERKLREYDSAKQVYEDHRYRYESMSPASKLVNRITGRKPKPPVSLRFAIRYDKIGLPFKHTEEKVLSKDYAVFVDSVDPIFDDDIDHLWTVVEYEGDGIFVDLVTGCKFRLAHYEKNMHEMFTGNHSYEEVEYKRIAGEYGKIVDTPLAIASPEELLSLDVNKKKAILDVTLPRAKEIKEKMGAKEVVARKAVVEKYQDEFFNYRDEYDARSDERRDRAVRKAEKEREKSELQQQIAAMERKAEEMAKVVDPMFDDAFPKSARR